MTGLARVVSAAGLCLALAPAAPADGVPELHVQRLRTSGHVMGLRTADLDRDGRLDLVVVSDRRILVFRQRAEGFPEWADTVVDAPKGVVLADVWAPPGAAPALLLVDRQGVLSWPWDATVQAFAGAPTRACTVAVPYRAPAGAPVLVRPIVRDVTGDATPELAIPVADGYRFFAGTPGGFVPAGGVPCDVNPRVALLEEARDNALYTEHFHPPLSAGDANGDGVADVLVREHGGVAIFHRAADGTLPARRSAFLSKDSIPRQKKSRLQIAFPIEVADVTGDGIVDYFHAIPGEGVVMVFTGRPGRTDLGTPDAVIKTDGYALGALPRDLDGDGKIDLLVGTVDRIGVMGALQVFLSKSITVHSLLYMNRGSAAGATAGFPAEPAARRDVTVPLAFTTTERGFQIGTTALATFDGDFDADGRRDLLQRVGPAALGIFRGKPGGGFSDEPDRLIGVPQFSSHRFVIPLVTDLDADGRADVVLHYRDWEDQANAVVVCLSGKKRR